MILIYQREFSDSKKGWNLLQDPEQNCKWKSITKAIFPLAYTRYLFVNSIMVPVKLRHWDNHSEFKEKWIAEFKCKYDLIKSQTMFITAFQLEKLTKTETHKAFSSQHYWIPPRGKTNKRNHSAANFQSYSNRKLKFSCKHEDGS